MTPADDIATAIELLRSVSTRLQQQHVHPDTRFVYGQALLQMEEAANNLAQHVFETEREHCPDCPHYERALHGDAHYGECNARTCYECPAVIELGYTDPSRPELSVPAYLRRQAT